LAASNALGVAFVKKAAVETVNTCNFYQGNSMSIKYLFAVLAAVSALAQAADSGASFSPSSPRVTPVSERLAAARKAIAAKDWAGAIGELEAAERADPRNADVHNLMGYTYRVRPTPDLPKAFEHYNIALKLDPNHKGLHEYIGEAYLMDKKPAEAEKHLAQLEKICGNKTCEEYVDLSASIADYKAKNKN
jgi:Flp pilus assembly protein TadD